MNSLVTIVRISVFVQARAAKADVWLMIKPKAMALVAATALSGTVTGNI